MSATRAYAGQAAGSFRACALVPIVVLPADGRVPRLPELDPRAGRALEIAIRAVRHLHAALRSAAEPSLKLEEAHILAVQAMRWLSESLEPAVAGVSISQADSDVPVHVYFGVRQRPLAPEKHAAQAAAVLHRVLADTRHARLDVNDLCAELATITAVLDGFAPATVDARLEAEAWVPPDARPPYEPAGDGLERWIVVHHAYFLLNLYAGATVKAATVALLDGAPGAAVLLREAAVYVRGFTAAMAHAAALGADHYEEVVRPTMQPPATPFPLTGAMQPEHASYRAAMRALLDACPEPFESLAQHDQEMALARDALLEADLADLERHVIVAATLVGGKRSLVQPDDSPENAVATLRRMRNQREARYTKLMRFGCPRVERAIAGGRR